MDTRQAMKKFYQEIEHMALTEGDKAICAQIAEKIIHDVMKEHVKTCPHAVKWKLIAAVFVGAVLGSGLVNGMGAAFAKLVIGL